MNALEALANIGDSLQAIDRLSSGRMKDHLATLLNRGCPALLTQMINAAKQDRATWTLSCTWALVTVMERAGA